jgi:hypothetical protein
MARKRDIKLVDDIARRLKLSEDQREMLHNAIHDQNLTYRQILEVAKDILEDYPNK